MTVDIRPGVVSDAVYDATAWDGVTGVAPSKNAVRDKIEALAGATVLLAGNNTLTGSNTFAKLGGKTSATIDDSANAGGVRGLVLNRVDQTVSVGLSLSTAGVQQWSAAALDYSNNNEDLILAFDVVGVAGGGSGDCLRMSHGGQMMHTFGASSPALTSTSFSKTVVPDGTAGGAGPSLHAHETSIRDSGYFNYWCRTNKAGSKRTGIAFGELASAWAIRTDYDDDNTANFFFQDLALGRATLFASPGTAKWFLGSNTPTATKPVPLATLHIKGHAAGDLPFLIEGRPQSVSHLEVWNGSSVAARVFSIDLNGNTVMEAPSGPHVKLRRNGTTGAAGAITWCGNDDVVKFQIAVNEQVGAGFLEFNYGAANKGTMDINGLLTMASDFESTTVGKGFVLKSPDGTRYRIAVSNIGVLSAAAA